jgi:hypothetical protein
VAGGGGPPLPQPSAQPPQPPVPTWRRALVEAANAAGGGVAIQQPPQIIRAGRWVGRVVRHRLPLRPPRWAAPARLAAWCIGRARFWGAPGRVAGGSSRRRAPCRVLPRTRNTVKNAVSVLRHCRSRASILLAADTARSSASSAHRLNVSSRSPDNLGIGLGCRPWWAARRGLRPLEHRADYGGLLLQHDRPHTRPGTALPGEMLPQRGAVQARSKHAGQQTDSYLRQVLALGVDLR